MENYKTLRMPELKASARDRRLRNYFQMRKAELVAFFDHLGWNYSPLCERMYYIRLNLIKNYSF